MQDQIDALEVQKLALDQELSTERDLLERERLLCESLKKSCGEKEGELEAVEGLLEKTQAELEEVSSKVLEKERDISDMISKLNAGKLAQEGLQKV